MFARSDQQNLGKRELQDPHVAGHRPCCHIFSQSDAARSSLTAVMEDYEARNYGSSGKEGGACSVVVYLSSSCQCRSNMV